MPMSKVIINAALTGMVPTRDMNPHVPLTPSEIAADAERVYRLGASIVHVHARDGDGRPSGDREIYREIIRRIRDRCGDMVITVSLSGRRVRDPRKRMQVLELDGDAKPDMASLMMGSLNMGKDYSLNQHEVILLFLTSMEEAGVEPELECFDLGMIDYCAYLYERGYLRGGKYANLVLGSLGGLSASAKNLVHMVDALPDGILWGATGIGATAFSIQCMALAMGGHVRVGLEDCLYMDEEKKEVATNEKLVRRVRSAAHAMGREVAAPGEVRSLLGLPALSG
jgi:3-keto-5-aminohexanoate cleavage enzyme